MEIDRRKAVKMRSDEKSMKIDLSLTSKSWCSVHTHSVFERGVAATSDAAVALGVEAEAAAKSCCRGALAGYTWR